MALTEAPAAATAGPPPAVGPAPRVRPRPALSSRRRQWIALAVVVAALLVLVVRGLGNATLYFRTADEAVAQRAQLANHRFRIEGTVQPGVHQNARGASFVVANNGVGVSVRHVGDPPQLFKPGIPVVLEGHFDTTGTFLSDRIMVKHTESYVAKHPDRVKAPGTIPAAPGRSAP